MSWIASLRDAVGEGISEFTASALKEAQETVKDSLQEVHPTAIDGRHLPTVPHRGRALSRVLPTRRPTAIQGMHASPSIAPPTHAACHTARAHPPQRSPHQPTAKTRCSASTSARAEGSKVATLKAPAQPQPHAPPPPPSTVAGYVTQACSVNTHTCLHTQHTPTTVGLVTPLRGSNALAEPRGGVRSHRDLSLAGAAAQPHHPPSAAPGSAPTHQPSRRSEGGRSKVRRSGSGHSRGTTPASPAPSRSSSRAAEADLAGIAEQGGREGAGSPAQEAFEELTLSESPPPKGVTPRHTRSVSAGSWLVVGLVCSLLVALCLLVVDPCTWGARTGSAFAAVLRMDCRHHVDIFVCQGRRGTLQGSCCGPPALQQPSQTRGRQRCRHRWRPFSSKWQAFSRRWRGRRGAWLLKGGRLQRRDGALTMVRVVGGGHTSCHAAAAACDDTLFV